ncbi:MAG: hypothetical protein K9M84_07965 [Spirochaetia bacterium]|nr:hypothetical protein [Spirochaetia bacterium]MCF7941533.1 hypothetical protein [Spirochaetia bacterium]
MELFLIGLGIGLLLFIISVIAHAHTKNVHKKEIQKIKQIVTQKMDLESDSLSQLKTDITALKEQNEHLRVSLRSMSQKTTKKEMTRFQIYERAIEIMSLKAPGFAPAWQTALRESEEEFDKVFFGLKPFKRRAVAAKITDKSDASLRIEDVTPREDPSKGAE